MHFFDPKIKDFVAKTVSNRDPLGTPKSRQFSILFATPPRDPPNGSKASQKDPQMEPKWTPKLTNLVQELDKRPQGTPKSRHFEDLFAPLPQGSPEDTKVTTDDTKVKPKRSQRTSKFKRKKAAKSKTGQAEFSSKGEPRGDSMAPRETLYPLGPERVYCRRQLGSQKSQPKHEKNEFLRISVSPTRNTQNQGSRVPKTPPKSTKNAPKAMQKPSRISH